MGPAADAMPVECDAMKCFLLTCSSSAKTIHCYESASCFHCRWNHNNITPPKKSLEGWDCSHPVPQFLELVVP